MVNFLFIFLKNQIRHDPIQTFVISEPTIITQHHRQHLLFFIAYWILNWAWAACEMMEIFRRLRFKLYFTVLSINLLYLNCITCKDIGISTWIHIIFLAHFKNKIGFQNVRGRWPWNSDCVTIRKLSYWWEKKKKTVFLLSLHFVLSLQSAFCILYLVCILYPLCSLQSAFCTDWISQGIFVIKAHTWPRGICLNWKTLTTLSKNF